MRRDNWRSNLFAFFSDIKRKPFDKNSNNCAQFVASGYTIMREDDPFKPYRKYKTYAALVRAVKKDGYLNHVDFYSTFLTAYDHPSQAQVGDIAVYKLDDDIGFASGFVIGTHVFVLREDGLGQLPLSSAFKVFQV